MVAEHLGATPVEGVGRGVSLRGEKESLGRTVPSVCRWRIVVFVQRRHMWGGGVCDWITKDGGQIDLRMRIRTETEKKDKNVHNPLTGVAVDAMV
jgi:hypothetical protein